jgi:hypothetical protein
VLSEGNRDLNLRPVSFLESELYFDPINQQARDISDTIRKNMASLEQVWVTEHATTQAGQYAGTAGPLQQSKPPLAQRRTAVTVRTPRARSRVAMLKQPATQTAAR